MTRLAVVYATVGRAEMIRRTVDHLVAQTRPPDVVLVSAVSPADVAGLEGSPLRPELLLGSKGLCAQRNRAMAELADRADIILFFDDDFLPAGDYLAQTVALFDAHPEITGATGRVIADGIGSAGIDFADAIGRIERDEPPAETVLVTIQGGLYGCNMAYRANKTHGLLFDEALPLYGWLEDLDFSYRLRARGPQYWCNRMSGVHLGVKGGRTSGVKLGYSQIANPLYLLRRKRAPRRHVIELMLGNVAANAMRSFRPEPYVDRRGRLRGNLLAVRDLLVGRLHPMRILELK